jgi:hypothetical protein
MIKYRTLIVLSFLLVFISSFVSAPISDAHGDLMVIGTWGIASVQADMARAAMYRFTFRNPPTCQVKNFRLHMIQSFTLAMKIEYVSYTRAKLVPLQINKHNDDQI